MLKNVINLLKNDLINHKDLIRYICGVLLILKSMLLIIDESYHLFFHNLDNCIFLKNALNYILSLTFIFSAIIILFGIKTRKTLFVLIPLLILNIIFTYQNIAVNHDIAVTCILLFLIFILQIVGYGNLTIEKNDM